MNDAARREDELSKQDTGRWKRCDVLLLCTWTMAHHCCDKKQKSNTSPPTTINWKTIMSTKRNKKCLVQMLFNILFLCSLESLQSTRQYEITARVRNMSEYYLEDSQIIPNPLHESRLLQYNVLITPRHWRWQVSSYNILQTSVLYSLRPYLLYYIISNMDDVVYR
jgi:hypothetical protein